DLARDPLRRLVEMERHPTGGRSRSLPRSTRRPERRPGPPRMGYAPSLDGLRAISVIAVILYHAGFSWAQGGFYGVEVFFVVSGFLITSLLLEDRERTGRISLRGFWTRRARRLMPALLTMLIAVAVWARLFGTSAQQYQLRGDLPWSIFYIANWGQIYSKVAYFSPVDPPLLRHMWSLAVEEQWYLVWPLVFIGLVAIGLDRRMRGVALVGLFAAVWLWMWWMTRPGLGTPMNVPNPLGSGTATVDRANALYLSTFTRSGGLLLGAGVAHMWRPWRARTPADATRMRTIERSGMAAFAALLIAFARADLTSASTFQWLLPIVSILSVVVIAVAVHPQSRFVRVPLSWPPLATIGRRSYGLYLWHWPIFVFMAAEGAGGARVMVALGLTVVVSEACYRFVETPIRAGGLGRLTARLRVQRGAYPSRATMRIRRAFVGGLIVIAAVTVSYTWVHPVDRAAGGADTAFTAPGIAAVNQPAAGDATVGDANPSADSAPPASGPLRMVLVGDSTAHSLAINLPKGIGSTFRITDGSIDGCSIFDTGRVASIEGYARDLSCPNWAAKWARSVSSSKAKLALVVIGAWDVLDITLDGTLYAVGTRQHDQLFEQHLQRGIDAMSVAGAHVALLQIPCMRPQEAKGAVTPPLPERGDDQRVAHLNTLLQQVAAAQPEEVTYVAGPTAWCNDPTISTSTAYRWDGVHVYKPGAKLIYDTVAASLLSMPA
ncbi:MAG: acyltransferase, partial [Ilumatobacteraceae bacterium]